MTKHILILDKERHLRFGFRALKLIRDALGGRGLNELADLPVDEMPKIVWAGLIHEDPNLTLEQVIDDLDKVIPEKYTIAEIIQIVMSALAEQLGAELPDDEQKKRNISRKNEKQP